MRVVEMAVVRNVECEMDSDAIIKVAKDKDRYTLILSSPGSRINAITIRNLSELQLRTMASEIILKV